MSKTDFETSLLNMIQTYKMRQKGMKLDDIAAKLGISQGTVTLRLQRLERLKRKSFKIKKTIEELLEC